MQVDVYHLMKVHEIAKSKKQSHRARGFKIDVATEEIVKRMYKALGGGCEYCGCEMHLNNGIGGHPLDNLLTLDIVNPSSRVLSDENMAFICCKCNQMKGNMDLDDFLWQCSLISEGLMIGGK